MDEEDKIAFVLEKALTEYAGILASTEKEKGNQLTMADLEEAMAIQFCIRYGDTEEDNSNEKEVTLAAFDGVCYNYSKKGHRSNECPEKNKSRGNKRFNGKCRGCGREGHKMSDCWELEKKTKIRGLSGIKNKEKAMEAKDDNDSSYGKEYLLVAHEYIDNIESKDRVMVEDKKGLTCFKCSDNGHKWANCRARFWEDDFSINGSESNWVNDDSSANGSNTSWVKDVFLMTLNGDGMEDQDQNKEYGLMGKSKTHTFVSSAKILNDPNIFIGDTGATGDTTNLKYGFFNVKKATKADSIVDAS
eukprot:1217488-Ditylum_brightwellii.AAC.2